MRRLHRVVMFAALLALAPVLAGCENFDPDKLDVFGLNEKKKLPGDRQPLFPEGVPGVSQGIPPEYMKGNTGQQTGAAIDTAQAPAPEGAQQTAAAHPAEPAKPKPEAKPKPKPKPRQASRPPTQVTVQPVAKGQNAAPAPQPAAAPQPAPAWPEPAQQQPQQAQSPWPTPGQSAPAPWPAAPPSGTFSR